jgi:hypothetical protein
MVKPIEGKSLKWTDEEKAQVVSLVGRLYSYNSQREAKFNRNLNRYYNSGRNVGDASATIWNPGYQSVGFNRIFYDDASVQTRLNVIKSAIDTVASKLAQARVRPFFDAVKGDYQTIKAARSAQIFFDQFFDSQKIYERAPETARSSMLFDGGHFWIDEENMSIAPLAHWELYINPYEVNAVGFRNATIGMVRRQNYPISAVKMQFPDNAVLAKYSNVARDAVCEFVIFYDLADGKKWYICNKDIIFCKAIDYKRLPVTNVWWSKPVLGWSTTCLADDLYTIQVTIDEIQLRMDQAVKQSPFNTVFVPVGSDVKGTMLSNEAGQIVTYNESGGGTPVVATPAPISDMYRQLLDSYIAKAYELAGVSQLSAQSKKPTGTTSGIALQTLEDVESERFEVIVQDYIHQFVELAELCVEVFPKDADVLPETMESARVKWGDIKGQKDLFRVQFSAGSALSKDPATKIQQIQQLQQLGINLQPILPQLLEIPDLETAYSATTASYDYVQSVIQRAAETGNIEYLPIVNLEMLFSETVRWMLRLSADEANKKYIINLNKLLERCQKEQAELQNPAPVPPVPPTPDVTMGGAPALPPSNIPPVNPAIGG